MKSFPKGGDFLAHHIIAETVFSKKLCESIISFHSNWNETIGDIKEGTVDLNIRQCMVYVPPTIDHVPKWFLNEIYKTIFSVNENYYNFDLGKDGFNFNLELTLLRYDSGGHYDAHCDIGEFAPNRKL